MIGQAFVRQFAAGQHIDLDVADQEVVLHYALALLNEVKLVGYPPGESTPGPLLFKGGTALRKCIFGSTGRFSQDIDLDATHENGFEEMVEGAFQADQPYHGIEFSLPRFRYSADGNFSGTVEYRHADGEGAFELQVDSQGTTPMSYLPPFSPRISDGPIFPVSFRAVWPANPSKSATGSAPASHFYPS